MARRRPRLDLTLPDTCRQIAEFCAEFPQHQYETIDRACRDVESRLTQLMREWRSQRAAGE